MSVTSKKPPLVIGFTGQNANGVLKEGTRFINQVLSSYGVEAHSIDLLAPDWWERLRALVTERTPHFCYGYAGIGSALLNGDRSFWTDYKTPFLSLMYDHPFSMIYNHTIDSPYVAACYFVGDFMEVRDAYVQNPHARFLMRDTVGGAGNPPRGAWRDRSISYLFIKSGNNPARLNSEIDALDALDRKIFFDCLDIMQHSADIHLTHLVAEHCRAVGMEPQAQNRNFVNITLLLERYMRDWRSTQLVEWLKHKPATIIGDGWDYIDKSNAKARFLPSIPAEQCWGLYCDSRFTFNANPCFRDGCHERVLGGLKAGAVMVSDRNRFSDHFFASLDNFVGFDWADPDWQNRLDARLAEIEAKGGAFDADATRQHLVAQFPVAPFVARLLTIAQEIRDKAG